MLSINAGTQDAEAIELRKRYLVMLVIARRGMEPIHKAVLLGIANRICPDGLSRVATAELAEIAMISTSDASRIIYALITGGLLARWSESGAPYNIAYQILL